MTRQGYRLESDDYMNFYLIREPQRAFLFIDGRLVEPEELRSVQLRMNYIANVMVTNISLSVSIFHVFTSDSYGKDTTVLFDRFVIKNGFDRAKKY